MPRTYTEYCYSKRHSGKTVRPCQILTYVSLSLMCEHTSKFHRMDRKSQEKDLVFGKSLVLRPDYHQESSRGQLKTRFSSLVLMFQRLFDYSEAIDICYGTAETMALKTGSHLPRIGVLLKYQDSVTVLFEKQRRRLLVTIWCYCYVHWYMLRATKNS